MCQFEVNMEEKNKNVVSFFFFEFEILAGSILQVLFQ